MEINSTYNSPNFGARIIIVKNNLRGVAKKLSNEEIYTDSSLLSASAGSTVTGLSSQTTALGPALHISAQTPQSQFMPEFLAKILPDSVWNFLQQFIKPTMGVKEDATISAYFSTVGTFLEKFGKSGMDWCGYTKKGNRNFPS